MAMKISSGGGAAAVDIDMTPMIDIVFQLITFFMVVINFDAADTDDRVKMAISDLARPPKVKPAEELVMQMGFISEDQFKSEKDPVRRAALRNHRRFIPEDGKKGEPLLFYNGEEIPLGEFLTRLQREKQVYRLKHPNKNEPVKTTVIIRADAECPTGKVQELIKLCQSEGYEKFSLKAMQPEAQ